MTKVIIEAVNASAVHAAQGEGGEIWWKKSEHR